MWVSPFRDLRINGYLLLPEAFRSLSRLSSALSAKACIALHALVQVNFFTLFSSKCCNHYYSFLFITITSDVLIFHQFLICGFQGTCAMRWMRAHQKRNALEACFHKLFRFLMYRHVCRDRRERSSRDWHAAIYHIF